MGPVKVCQLELRLCANKYQGTWVCFLAFYGTLAGTYVEFGVFEPYGAPSLQNALTVTLRMALSGSR